MNRLLPLFISLALATLLACSGSSENDEADIPDDRGLDIATLPQSKKLAGKDVVEARDGPWTIRRTASPRNGRGGPGRGADFEGGFEADGAVAMKGDVHGAPVESPSMDIAPGDSGGSDARGAAPPPTGGGAPDTEDFSPRPQNAGPLRAGATDDNEKYDEFLTFLAQWGDRESTVGRYQMLDVADRRYLRVIDKAGAPVPGATVRVVDEAADRIVLAGTTYGDGRVPYYPHLFDKPGDTVSAAASVEGNLIVEVRLGEAKHRIRWDGDGEEFTIQLDGASGVSDPIALDVVFLIDTTGSMGDEIGRIKASLLGMTGKLRSLEREFDLRYGGVLYRDVGDEYVTKSHPFTADIEAFDSALQLIRANGGGDGPESLNQGLAEAVGHMDWRSGAAKVMFLIADAPPHMDYEGDVFYGESLKAALAKGIRIHSVAASGIDEVGSLVFRQVAQFTRGKFIFIEYGTVEKSAAAHGVTGKVKSNNLDDILFEQIREEVARWGR